MRIRRQCRCPPGKEKTLRAYLWAYSTTQSPDLRAVVYDFAITRVIRIPTLLTPSVQGWPARRSEYHLSQQWRRTQ
jgi:hypothetical protein